ncbi:CvpA family protein [Tengunoibacter tsumagoiensis]|uniref:CvpA family protein n=1 Tax=Tengunoibacter tsumagoiensis TaxID=2014871 RepID=A0A402A5I9_9CHLR|nr:CvpA family protein [Tengunoibacter tsumagoiensis]GCE14285.1 hypothetical protein KTT_41440 [Tengunoibacter tsumagoiensis]
MALSVIDLLFVITMVLLIINGLRNGAIFSLVSLLILPVGLGVAYFYGPSFTELLANNGIPATPLISYGVLFIGSILVLHILGNLVRGVVKSVPLVSQGDTLLGGAIGFVEAWLIWLILLIILGTFLGNVQSSIQQGSTLIPGFNIHVDQLQAWHDFYNQAVTNSLFAKVNGLFVKQLPNLPHLPQ